MILLSRIVIDKFIYIVRLTEPESAPIVTSSKARDDWLGKWGGEGCYCLNLGLSEKFARTANDNISYKESIINWVGNVD